MGLVIGTERLQKEYRHLCDTLNRYPLSRQSVAYRRIVRRMERIQDLLWRMETLWSRR